MRKLNKKHVMITFIPIIVMIVLIFWFVFRKTETLELIGNEKEIFMLNSIYEEKGTNLEDVEMIGNVDTSQEGQYEIKYQYKNQTVKRFVEVLNNKQIVMNLNGSQDTYVLKGQKYIESGCHVIDQNEGNLTDQVKITGKVDTQKVGDYEIIYSVQNKEGIYCSKKRTVHVVNEFEKNSHGIPVLMYHYVYTPDDLPKTINTNYILDSKLEEQLKYLKDQDFYFPSYQELSAYIKGEIDLPKKSVILTFDDGQKGFLKYGIPLLEKYQIPATSFIIASQNGKEKVKKYASEYITFQSHSYDMHKGGGNIGHGGIISALNMEQIKEDLLKAQNIVENTEAFAYPYGDVTVQGQQAIQEAEILCAFTTEYGKVKKGQDPTKLPRVRVLGESSLQSYIASLGM